MNRSKKIFMLSCLSISLLAGLTSTAQADDDGWGRFGLNLFMGAPAYYAPPVYVPAPQPAYAYYGPPAPPPAYYGPPGPPPGYYNGGYGGYGGDGGYGRGRWGRGGEGDDD